MQATRKQNAVKIHLGTQVLLVFVQEDKETCSTEAIVDKTCGKVEELPMRTQLTIYVSIILAALLQEDTVTG